jgi:hypothetical protein
VIHGRVLHEVEANERILQRVVHVEPCVRGLHLAPALIGRRVSSTDEAIPEKHPVCSVPAEAGGSWM